MKMNQNQQINSLSLNNPFSLQNQAQQQPPPSSLSGTQFAVLPNPSLNAQYSFLVPINNINYHQPSVLPINPSMNQWYNISPLMPPNIPNLPLNMKNSNQIQLQIPSTITSINNLSGFPDVKFPILPSTDTATISPQSQLFKLAPLSAPPYPLPNLVDTELKLKTNIQDTDNRIISFNPNNSGQIIITKREHEHEPMVNSINPLISMRNIMNNSSSTTSNDDDDKRSIQSSSSTVSTSSVRASRKPDYQCIECGKAFKHKSNLKIHSVIHTDQALQCTHCAKKFARKSNLTQHLRVHTGERPYICGFCNKSFKQSHSLKDHVRIHTGEKPYECEFCSKSFKVKHNMVVHRRLHTGEKPFDCPLCLKKFASKSSLNGHTKKTHPNQWWSLHPDCKIGAKKYDALLNKQDDDGEEEEE